MPFVATQTIASGFGTFHVGDAIDADLHPDVAAAWQAAGLVEEAEAKVAEEAPEPAKKPTPQKRVSTKPSPQRRFVEDATAAPAERATTGPKG